MFPIGGCVIVALCFEFRHVLMVIERRGRITPAQSAEFLAIVHQVPISLDHDPIESVVMELARQHQLSFDIAAYLELGKRRDGVRCTLDQMFEQAARSAGVEMFA